MNSALEMLGDSLKCRLRALSRTKTNTLSKTRITPSPPVKPVARSVKPPGMRAPAGASVNFSADFDPENPLHEHARQLHESAAAHAALMASIKAVHAGQAVNASTGPAAL